MSESGGNKTSMGLQQNVAALLCYLGTWITGIIFFLIEKENKTVKFHAMQSIITFGGLNIIMFVVGFIPVINLFAVPVLWVVEVILWIVLMVKAYQGQMIKLPIAGDIAEKQIK